MNCQVILENELHEKYLLDQLQKSEKADYEKHVKQCVACGKGFENLRALIGGIRRAGGEQMKAEILRQAEFIDLNRTKINWVKISRIAAVLFFFILTPSVIYYLKRNETPILPTTSGPYLRYQFGPDDSTQSLSEVAESDVSSRSPAREEMELLQEKSSANPIGALKKGAERKRGLAAGNQLHKSPRISTKDEDAESGTKKQALMESGQIVEATTRFEADAPPTEMPIKTGFVEKQTVISQGMAKSALESSAIRIYTYQTPEDRATTFLAQDEARRISTESDLPVSGSWKFRSDGYIVDVHPTAVEEKSAETSQAGAWPESFPVEIIARDSTRITMNWLLPESVINVDASAIRLELNQESVLLVLIEKRVYRIELGGESQRAVLVK